MFRLAVIATLFVAAAGQCEVCGEGKEVSNPDGVFTFPNQPNAPCGELQEAGRNGEITDFECPFLPSLITVCDCQPVTGSAPTVSPAPTNGPCHICGEGFRIKLPQALIEFEGQGPVTCDEAAAAALAGSIGEENCDDTLRAAVDVICGCEEMAPLATSTPSMAGTMDDVPAPTPAPAPTSGGSRIKSCLAALAALPLMLF